MCFGEKNKGLISVSCISKMHTCFLMGECAAACGWLLFPVGIHLADIDFTLQHI